MYTGNLSGQWKQNSVNSVFACDRDDNDVIMMAMMTLMMTIHDIDDDGYDGGGSPLKTLGRVAMTTVTDN